MRKLEVQSRLTRPCPAHKLERNAFEILTLPRRFLAWQQFSHRSAKRPPKPSCRPRPRWALLPARFLDSLTAEQKSWATFEYMDGERMYWYYPPINRHGLALRDMDANQRELAFALLESGLTPALLRTVPPDNGARRRSRPTGKRDGHGHLRA